MQTRSQTKMMRERTARYAPCIAPSVQFTFHSSLDLEEQMDRVIDYAIRTSPEDATQEEMDKNIEDMLESWVQWCQFLNSK